MLSTTLIEIPSWGNLTLIEFIWLMSGLFTMYFCLSHMPTLYKDWQVAKTTQRPTLILVAWSYVRREILRTFKGAVIAAVGIYAALEPPLLPGPAVVTITGLILTGALMSISVSTSVMSVWDFRTRNQIQALIAEGKNGIHEALPKP